MKLLFQNRTVITKDIYTESCKAVSQNAKNNKIYTVFCAAFFVMAFFNLLVGYLLLGVLMTVGTLAVLWFLRFGYQFTAARGYKKVLADNHGQPPERTVSFFDEKIHVVSEKEEKVWKYPQIRYIKQEKSTIVLGLDDNRVVMLDGESFDGIDRAGFVEFLIKKCPEAKW